MGFDRKPVYSMKDWADVAWSDRWQHYFKFLKFTDQIFGAPSEKWITVINIWDKTNVQVIVLRASEVRYWWTELIWWSSRQTCTGYVLLERENLIKNNTYVWDRGRQRYVGTIQLHGRWQSQKQSLGFLNMFWRDENHSHLAWTSEMQASEEERILWSSLRWAEA